MKRKAIVAGIIACLYGLTANAQPAGRIVCPSKQQLAWMNDELGVIFHMDMFLYKPDYYDRDFGHMPPASIFNPTELNTDQWIAAAKQMGAKYAILVTKHGSGFSLWPTHAHDYSVKNCPWKNGQGDIVKMFVASCHKYGIKPGFYYNASVNGYLWVDTPGRVQVEKGAPLTQQDYNKMLVQQLAELWTNYGKLYEIWFDGGLLSPEAGGADVRKLLERLQPDAIAFAGPCGYRHLTRWVGNEIGTAPYPCWATTDSIRRADGSLSIKWEALDGNPYGPFWCPAESDCTLRTRESFMGGWGWTPGQDDMMYSVDQLMEKYVTSVGRNTNMLLGIVVDDKGLVPEGDIRRAAEFGREIQRRFGHPLKRTSGKGEELTLDLGRPASIDRVILQERIAKGERVLAYELQGFSGGQWKTLTTGSCIGHKHIQQFAPVTVEKLRLKISHAKATPLISNFAVFETLRD